MGKIILKGKDSITVSLGRFELAVFVEEWSNTIQRLYEAEEQDLNQIMLLLTAIDPFIEFATPETQNYLNEIKNEILSPQEEEIISGEDIGELELAQEGENEEI